ncbi:MAG: alpha/beta hydrolase family protein [Thermoguttaceae bacterium]|nr:alpha/beta hydrolase family protein [Thermoguttaceae bacterium]
MSRFAIVTYFIMIAAPVVSPVPAGLVPCASAQVAEAAGHNKPGAVSTVVTRTIPAMPFDPTADFAEWQSRLRERLVDIVALPAGPHGPLDARVERQEENERYTLDRIEFTAEPGELVPGYLLLPKDRQPPYPVMICLQGHSPGMHISIGRAKTEHDQRSIDGGRDIAVQAVTRGWAALAIEQRGFGERAEKGVTCRDASLRALHCGRPITGGRVLDVMRAIDFIESRPDLDQGRVGCMGNSAGGTVTFYTACVEPRIRLAVVSCSFCPFADSWLALPPRCACGYLPGIYAVADMPDLAGLIAPRHLLVVAASRDNLAPVESVRLGFEVARAAFDAAKVPEHTRLVVGDGGHQFYPDLAWPVIQAVLESW